jgi:hypothetical protein
VIFTPSRDLLTLRRYVIPGEFGCADDVDVRTSDEGRERIPGGGMSEDCTVDHSVCILEKSKVDAASYSSYA